MDKFEYKVRADEIKELISEGNYAEAAEIADSIDWRRVKSVMMLCMISDLYKINRRYEDAKNMLLLAYERRPGGRTICYSLCELCLKTQEFVQAVNYYKEFIQVAPNDSGRFILQYKILEAQDVSLEERIQVLQELKASDYREKWAYELAYLYHRTGQASRCVDECDELILWFGDGKYVIKAMELKMQHQPLTPEQQVKYDHRFDKPVQEIVTEAVQEAEGTTVSHSEEISTLPQVQQEVVAESVPVEEVNVAEATTPAETTVFSREQVTELVKAVQPEEAVSAAQEQTEEPEIHVKTMDVGEYNTINLQAELAAGLQAILGEEKATRAIVAPLLQGEEEEVQPKAVDRAAGEEIEATEVFFGETGEISRIQPEHMISVDTQDMKEVTVEDEGESGEALPEETSGADVPKAVQEVTSEVDSEAKTKEALKVEAVLAEADEASEEGAELAKPGETSGDALEEQREAAEMSQEGVHDVTAQIVMEQMRMEGMGTPEQQVLAAEPPKALAGVLSQESDGQIRLVIPERESVEKQITGQMNIDDILAEWERMKKESEEKRKEEVRQHVLQQTGTMFTEFEASIRDGLLEKLESGEADSVDELLATLEADAEVEESAEEAEELAEAEYATPEAEAAEETAEELPAEEAEETAEELPEEEAEETAEELPEEEAEEIAEELPEEEAEETAEELPEEEAKEIEEELPEEAVEEIVDELSEEAAEEYEMSETESDELGDMPEQSFEQDAPKVRALTREERELYAPFIQGRTARERLVKAIDAISLAAYTGNIVITGEEGMDTMLLAKNMMREIQMSDSNFSGRVAKVSGEGLNQRDVEGTVKQLSNGALIIQKASGMNGETANKLHKLLQQENFGIIVVLEDTKKGISQLFASNPKLSASFTARMDVEALSNDSLVAFGKKYAREMEFSIDEMGILALHTRIEELQTIDHAVTVMEVKEIVDEAIHNAKRKTFKHFVDVLFAKRYDDEDMIILTEKDFA